MRALEAAWSASGRLTNCLLLYIIIWCGTIKKHHGYHTIANYVAILVAIDNHSNFYILISSSHQTRAGMYCINLFGINTWKQNSSRICSKGFAATPPLLYSNNHGIVSASFSFNELPNFDGMGVTHNTSAGSIDHIDEIQHLDEAIDKDLFKLWIISVHFQSEDICFWKSTNLNVNREWRWWYGFSYLGCSWKCRQSWWDIVRQSYSIGA